MRATEAHLLGAHPLPLVTVGMGVFNGGEDLAVALECLGAQDYPNLEILICDDGSTDGSYERCQAFARDRADCRVIRNERQLGIIANYNQMITLAGGTYFVYADQDDRRGQTYISRCVEILEQDPDAVLCHSHTAVVWPGMRGRTYHINTLDGLDGIRSLSLRYWRFLRRYADTTVYGLMRLDALRRTERWQPGLGSSNRLLFELLMMGPFRQVPEIAFWYTAKGLKQRPNPADEFARGTGGRAMPRWYLPFLAVALAQTRGITRAEVSAGAKLALFVLLWLHVALVNGTKAVYRALWRLARGRLPARFERACAELVYSTADLRFLVRPEEDCDYYPEGWPLRGS